jgi:tRNA(fMet)-specific endonuclease VapC
LHDTGADEAQTYGLLVKSLRQAGTPVPTNDIWIAATAFSQSAAVITRDSHFENFKGLLVISF